MTDPIEMLRKLAEAVGQIDALLSPPQKKPTDEGGRGE